MHKVTLINDIYYNQAYAELYVDRAKGQELFEYKYSEGKKTFINLAIKRPIAKIKGKAIKESWYDLETPYGYGGYYVNTEDEKFVDTALSLYAEKCKEEKIIAEFVRFHPFNDFPLKYAEKLSFCNLDRQVVVVDLAKNKEERWAEYGSTTRNIIRKCEKNMKVVESRNIDLFLSLYTETMKRNKAEEFYYFDKSYLKNLLKIPGISMCEVQAGGNIDIDGADITIPEQKRRQTIAVGFFMYGSELAHYHLSANDTDYIKLNANYYMLDSMFDKAREQGLKYVLLGGGRTNNPEDALLMFKQKFSKLTKDFYIAGRIFNEGKYKEYSNIWTDKSTGEEKKLFLKYRG